MKKYVEFTIIVAYPADAANYDFENMLDELTEYASDSGLEVDGYYEVDPIRPVMMMSKK